MTEGVVQGVNVSCISCIIVDLADYEHLLIYDLWAFINICRQDLSACSTLCESCNEEVLCYTCAEISRRNESC